MHAAIREFVPYRYLFGPQGAEIPNWVIHVRSGGIPGPAEQRVVHDIVQNCLVTAPRDPAAGRHPGYENYNPRRPTRRQPLPPLHPIDDQPTRKGHRQTLPIKGAGAADTEYQGQRNRATPRNP